MNVGEYGIAFNLSVGYDISGNTGLTLNFVRPNNTTFSAAKPDVAVGTTTITTTQGIFTANQYTIYTFKNGDLPVAGVYSVRLTYDDATKHLISDATTFTINP